MANGIFKKLFSGVLNKSTGMFSMFKMMNGAQNRFSSFGKEGYEASVTRACINAIVQNGAKLKPVHIVSKNGTITKKDGKYQHMLAVRPNRYMNAFDFYLKLITQLMNLNNAFCYVNYEKNNTELYPINYSSVEAIESEGVMYLRFWLVGGDWLAIPYDEVIHLRRHFYNGDLFGESNDAIASTLDLINTLDQGLSNAVESSGNIRGVLKFSQAMMKAEDMEAQRKKFVDSYMSSTNNGGIAATDSKAEFVPTDNKAIYIDPEQMKAINERFYEYYHVNESIIKSDYTEDQWNAFYESVIEPLAIQMSLEFTTKLLTPGEQSAGNQIVFESNRLQYASISSKIKMVKELMPLGLLSFNDGREIFNMSPVDGGDKRLISLNYIDSEIQSEYQLAKAKAGEFKIPKKDGDDVEDEE